MIVSTAGAPRRRVLFVDDEINVLDGLKNLLHRQRRQWEMVFTTTGQKALDELERAPFDVIVTDMRMPGIDGAALLGEVKRRFPRVARIVLSGHAEREAVLRAVPVAHQFLSKPCDAGSLQEVIEQTCSYQALIHDETVRAVVGSLDKLPSAPGIYLELTAAIADSDVSVGSVARIVERDPAMSAKLLQLVNSAYFGLSRRLVSVEQAVAYLGMELVKGLVLSVHVFASAECASVRGFSLEKLQRHSLLTARLARKFAGADRPTADLAFTTGLVHDVGRIVLAFGLPQRFAEFVERAGEPGGGDLLELEQELFGVTHAQAGAFLLGVWGLPMAIVEATYWHHAPAGASAQSARLVSAVHVADALSGGADDGIGRGVPPLDEAFLERAGLAAELPAWRVAGAELMALTKEQR